MKTLSSVLLLAASVAVAIVYTACDVASPGGEVIVSPSSVALKKGHSAQFTASGGFEYRWRLENEDWGLLSTRRGPSTVYTSYYDPREVVSGVSANTKPEVQIIYADSYIPDSGIVGGTSNDTSDVLQTGEAYITHLTECDVDCMTNKTAATAP